ncbi:FAD-dependent oxidoreductase [Streptomyces himalayensis]|uniref:FAD-binding oxidoreductase n=1 Tax=Streptomyces himalayensis subsp. himalayensis TaxID=2756131 RepID=A0A7W0ICN1_9ACTN|nr:FAD-dependent oxidoreductase [Streptomyces himalayensis]MBA2950567.1 FAD-binding oxidoreductase [Streptomyces himalayensis subsp. himalayensis]
MSAVVVVGAGIVGASVAYHLARRGVSVTLIDGGASPATGVTGDSFAWIGGSEAIGRVAPRICADPSWRTTNDPGLIRTIVVTRDFEAREVRDGRLLLTGEPAAALRRPRPQR